MFRAMSTEALRRAVELAGGQKALAERIAGFLGRPTISQQTVSYWITNEVSLAAEYCIAIEQITGRKVRARDLRPDIWKSA